MADAPPPPIIDNEDYGQKTPHTKYSRHLERCMEGNDLTVADRCTSKCCILVFQDTVQSAHDAGTGASNRMPQGNGATENIHFIQIKVQDPARKGAAKDVTKKH